MENFANVGKAVLLQSLGLQKNYSESVETTVEVTDYNTTACSSCKYCSIIRSFNPESDAYKAATEACMNCPHRVTTTEKTYKKIYHNERNHYGYKPMLKSMAIKLLLLFHFYHPDQFGVINNISYIECADMLHCNPRTIHNNLNILSAYGYISYSKNSSHYFSVCLNDYESYYLPATKGGRGYIVMSKELLKKVLTINNLMSLRIHLRELVELDTLSLKGAFTAVNKTFSDIKLSLPAYCKPCIIRSCMKDDSGIFNITYRDNVVRFEILEQFECKKQKAELFNSYITMFTDFISGFNKAVTQVNISNYMPAAYSSFFDMSDRNYPADMTGSYCMIHINDYEIEDIAQLSMQYSFDNVIEALSSIYKDYIMREKSIGNLGALLRTIILANMQHRGSPGTSVINAA